MRFQLIITVVFFFTCSITVLPQNKTYDYFGRTKEQAQADYYLEEGNAKFDNEDYKGAVKDYTKAIKLNPKFATAYFNRGNAKLKLVDYIGAMQDYTKTIKIDPKYDAAYNNYRIAKQEKNIYEVSLQWHNKNIEKDSTSAYNYWRRGGEREKLRDYYGAIDDYTKATEMDSNFYSAYADRGKTKHRLKDYKGAIKDYSKSIKLNPEEPGVYFNRGDAKFALGDKNGACLDWKKCQEVDDTYLYQAEVRRLKQHCPELYQQIVAKQREQNRKRVEMENEQKRKEDKKVFEADQKGKKKIKELKCGDNFVYEGKTYHIIKIGAQCWLKENLDAGMMIPGNVDQSDNGKIEKYCYKNIADNCATYGGLYQWNEVMQYVTTEKSKGICPPGWHIPTEAELTTAVYYNSNALEVVGKRKGTNTSGFSALLAGMRSSDGSFSGIGEEPYTRFWSSTESDESSAEGLFLDRSSIYFSNYDKQDGDYIRCIKD